LNLEVLSHAIERPGFRQKVGPSLPSGSSYTVTTGEANTVSVGASFEISGGFFEIFEAGASTSFESGHTAENSSLPRSMSTAVPERMVRFTGCPSGTITREPLSLATGPVMFGILSMTALETT
jgi:hypothetical protein